MRAMFFGIAAAVAAILPAAASPVTISFDGTFDYLGVTHIVVATETFDQPHFVGLPSPKDPYQRVLVQWIASYEGTIDGVPLVPAEEPFEPTVIITPDIPAVGIVYLRTESFVTPRRPNDDSLLLRFRFTSTSYQKALFPDETASEWAQIRGSEIFQLPDGPCESLLIEPSFVCADSGFHLAHFNGEAVASGPTPTEVPEPSTLALALSFIGAGAIRRKRCDWPAVLRS